MRSLGTLAAASIAAILIAACGGGAPATPSAAAPIPTTSVAGPGTAAGGCVVGVSWSDLKGRWGQWDEPAIKQAVGAAGGRYLSTDAAQSAATQAADVDSLIAKGATVLVILAQDGPAIGPVVAAATARGIPVIAYDRLIDDPAALYVTFDNVEVGRMQARALLAVAPKGNYLFIKGDKADANSDLVRSGQAEVLASGIEAGNVVNVGESYIRNWDPGVAQSQTGIYLAANGNRIAAVLAENDGMAGGVIAALDAVHLAGSTAVSGQDGDIGALNAVAAGTLTIDVWKDARTLGAAAGNAAAQLCAGATAGTVSGTTAFLTPSGKTVHSIRIEPVAVTRDNLNVVLEADWISKGDLCEGIASGSVAACG
ncbi:MAG: substrate-binding domain-containing protein [Chloroflexi bacterium]|nr:substrate-binding domain-containing protein [Chloroflexota bacterium]